MKKRIFHDTEVHFNVCTWTFTKCSKPNDTPCPYQDTVQNCLTTQDIITAVKKSRSCNFMRDKLLRSQWDHHRYGVLIH